MAAADGAPEEIGVNVLQSWGDAEPQQELMDGRGMQVAFFVADNEEQNEAAVKKAQEELLGEDAELPARWNRWFQEPGTSSGGE